jgi:hypothetical protein
MNHFNLGYIPTVALPVAGQSGHWASAVIIKLPDQKMISNLGSISTINQPVYIKIFDLGKFITMLAQCLVMLLYTLGLFINKDRKIIGL